MPDYDRINIDSTVTTAMDVHGHTVLAGMLTRWAFEVMALEAGSIIVYHDQPDL